MFCSISSADGGTLKPLWLGPQILVSYVAPRTGEVWVWVGEGMDEDDVENFYGDY